MNLKENVIVISYKHYWNFREGKIFAPSNQNTYFSRFGNLLSKNLVVRVLNRECTPLKGVLKECHSILNAGVGVGVPLNFLAKSGSGSATQKIWYSNISLPLPLQKWSFLLNTYHTTIARVLFVLSAILLNILLNILINQDLRLERAKPWVLGPRYMM